MTLTWHHAVGGYQKMKSEDVLVLVTTILFLALVLAAGVEEVRKPKPSSLRYLRRPAPWSARPCALETRMLLQAGEPRPSAAWSCAAWAREK